MNKVSNKIWSLACLKILLYSVLALYAIITLIPFLWAISASFKPLTEIVAGEANFLPKNFTLDNYKQIFIEEPLFLRWFFNSVIIAISVTILNLLFNSMAGYALARLKFRGRRFWFFQI